ncbi:cytochrome c biogenesis protein CcdA [Lichenihabitans sp. Uapishka_5]|uniref:cytochrome c biogenesis CcdA family protein n=1 Tax=Lichenihabitans sp. Uapishka_5 TaxID=3037302 RepID=UPI0029E811E1|nr:cytochrome c biogenesis protein CcdA [Lichenihabitans sp. Uapishka_5]MDX7949890.1 cytochrome c biogenesis protein CcdA [Lichenihabitans sp. Uapishka_5]
MSPHISVTAAFLAGLVSFLSPCVLPLVPPYLCYLAGTTLDTLQHKSDGRSRRQIVLASLVFVAGFTTVFVALGATASAFGQLIRRFDTLLSAAAGLAIIVMGLHFLGLFRLAFLYREKRVSVERATGLGPAYLMGLAFAFGWTPCIGPILAAILAIAGSEATVGRGAALLAAYSAGLGLPFVASAFMVGGFVRFSRGFRRYFPAVEKVAGGLLVLTGLAFLSGGMQSLSFWLLQTFPGLAALG